MAANGPKQYMTIAGQPMLRHTCNAFLSSPLIARTFVVVSPNDGQIDAVAPGDVSVLRCGGATRMESVRNALQAMAGEVHDDDWVLVHDAARPGLTAALIARLIDAVGNDAVGGLLALPVVDTVKRSGTDSARGAAACCVTATVARDGLWLAQTPQMFRYRLLRDALAAATDPDAITDDASAIEALGHAPRLVEGHPCNLKVTRPADVRIAEMYLAAPSVDC